MAKNPTVGMFVGDAEIERRERRDTPEPALLSEAQLAEIAERESKATAGPWEASAKGYRYVGAVRPPGNLGGHDVCNPDDYNGARLYPANRKNNAEFIAHSRADIPALLAHIRAQAERVRELEGRIEFLEQSADLTRKGF